MKEMLRTSRWMFAASCLLFASAGVQAVVVILWWRGCA